MGIEFVDKTGELRTTEELEQALRAVQKEMISGGFSPMMLHYAVIMDVLKEGIVIRKHIKKGD
jgi:hypothetical protein